MTPREHLERCLDYCNRAEVMAARALPPISQEGLQRELILAQVEVIRASVEFHKSILETHDEVHYALEEKDEL